MVAPAALLVCGGVLAAVARAAESATPVGIVNATLYDGGVDETLQLTWDYYAAGDASQLAAEFDVQVRGVGGSWRSQPRPPRTRRYEVQAVALRINNLAVVPSDAVFTLAYPATGSDLLWGTTPSTSGYIPTTATAADVQAALQAIPALKGNVVVTLAPTSPSAAAAGTAGGVGRTWLITFAQPSVQPLLVVQYSQIPQTAWTGGGLPVTVLRQTRGTNAPEGCEYSGSVAGQGQPGWRCTLTIPGRVPGRDYEARVRLTSYTSPYPLQPGSRLPPIGSPLARTDAEDGWALAGLQATAPGRAAAELVQRWVSAPLITDVDASTAIFSFSFVVSNDAISADALAVQGGVDGTGDGAGANIERQVEALYQILAQGPASTDATGSGSLAALAGSTGPLNDHLDALTRAWALDNAATGDGRFGFDALQTAELHVLSAVLERTHPRAPAVVLCTGKVEGLRPSTRYALRLKARWRRDTAPVLLFSELWSAPVLFPTLSVASGPSTPTLLAVRRSDITAESVVLRWSDIPVSGEGVQLVGYALQGLLVRPSGPAAVAAAAAGAASTFPSPWFNISMVSRADILAAGRTIGARIHMQCPGVDEQIAATGLPADGGSAAAGGIFATMRQLEALYDSESIGAGLTLPAPYPTGGCNYSIRVDGLATLTTYRLRVRALTRVYTASGASGSGNTKTIFFAGDWSNATGRFRTLPLQRDDFTPASLVEAATDTPISDVLVRTSMAAAAMRRLDLPPDLLDEARAALGNNATGATGAEQTAGTFTDPSLAGGSGNGLGVGAICWFQSCGSVDPWPRAWFNGALYLPGVAVGGGFLPPSLAAASSVSASGEPVLAVGGDGAGMAASAARATGAVASDGKGIHGGHGAVFLELYDAASGEPIERHLWVYRSSLASLSPAVATATLGGLIVHELDGPSLTDGDAAATRGNTDNDRDNTANSAQLSIITINDARVAYGVVTAWGAGGGCSLARRHTDHDGSDADLELVASAKLICQHGGNGSLAQATVTLQQGWAVGVLVGMSGRGTSTGRGGAGGIPGGAIGGDGVSVGGGGGGGASLVFVEPDGPSSLAAAPSTTTAAGGVKPSASTTSLPALYTQWQQLVLARTPAVVAAGGGGAGAEEHCCAGGGSGGGVFGRAGGAFAGYGALSTDDSFDSSTAGGGDGLYDYQAATALVDDTLAAANAAATGSSGAGTNNTRSFTVQAQPGTGGDALLRAGGAAGFSPANVSTQGVEAAGFSMARQDRIAASGGTMLSAGRGASGQYGGGGGGGGIYGGGGGGSGVGGGGGGGGASYFHRPALYRYGTAIPAPTQPTATAAGPRSARVEWDAVQLVGPLVTGDAGLGGAHAANATGGFDVKQWLGTAGAALGNTSFAYGNPLLEVWSYTIHWRAVPRTSRALQPGAAAAAMGAEQQLVVPAYTLRQSAKCACAGGVCPLGCTARSMLLDHVLQPDTRYQVWVTARRRDGVTSPPSAVAVFETNPLPPACPWSRRATGPQLKRTTRADPGGNGLLRLSVPPPLRGASLVELNGALYLFGGLSTGRPCNDRVGAADGPACLQGAGVRADTWRLNLQTNEWAQLATADAVRPPPRERHVAVVFEGGMYVLGGRSHPDTGRDGEPYFNDMWRLDLDTNTDWQLFGASGTAAQPPGSPSAGGVDASCNLVAAETAAGLYTDAAGPGRQYYAMPANASSASNGSSATGNASRPLCGIIEGSSVLLPLNIAASAGGRHRCVREAEVLVQFGTGCLTDVSLALLPPAPPPPVACTDAAANDPHCVDATSPPASAPLASLSAAPATSVATSIAQELPLLVRGASETSRPPSQLVCTPTYDTVRTCVEGWLSRSLPPPSAARPHPWAPLALKFSSAADVPGNAFLGVEFSSQQLNAFNCTASGVEVRLPLPLGPVRPVTSLRALQGYQADGQWRLRAQDRTTNRLPLIVRNWGLRLRTGSCKPSPRWSRVLPASPAAEWPLPAADMSAALLGRRWYVWGGWGSTGVSTQAEALWIYSFDAGSWERINPLTVLEVPPLPLLTGMRGQTVAVVPGSGALVRLGHHSQPPCTTPGGRCPPLRAGLRVLDWSTGADTWRAGDLGGNTTCERPIARRYAAVAAVSMAPWELAAAAAAPRAPLPSASAPASTVVFVYGGAEEESGAVTDDLWQITI